MTVVSLTRGAVELRLVRVRGAAGLGARLRIGGWPVEAGSASASDVRPVPWGGTLDDGGTWARETPHPMGEHLTIPWVGTSGEVSDGDYAAVVGLGEGLRAQLDGARFLPGGRFAFADGSVVDLNEVWSGLPL